MRSQFVDKFNHDDDAADYDADVADESQPVRAGYGQLLDWLAARANADCHDDILELGVGTANLSLRLSGFRHLLAVDASERMLQIAREKLALMGNIELIQADLLEYFDHADKHVDVVLSSYAIHHLTQAEKWLLFGAIKSALNPGGRAIFGDLMFADRKAEKRYLDVCRGRGMGELAKDIEQEFFWYLDEDLAQLRRLGFELESRQFSELAWGIEARLPV